MNQPMKPKCPSIIRQAAAALLAECLFVFITPGLVCTPALALEGAIGVHDPSTVAICEGKYYVYGTGRGISVLTSSNGFDWERGQRVFDRIPESVKSYVPKNNGADVWAPDIIKLNGEYYLYYSISFWGQYVSAVGLMTNPTLNTNSPDYKWTDRGMVVHSVEGENLNAIDREYRAGRIRSQNRPAHRHQLARDDHRQSK
jgi:arabinan endo-1,5-alpha-L-arabinosidase